MNNTSESSMNDEDHLNGNIGVENPDIKSTNSLTRRSFLGRTGVSSVVMAAASAGLPSLLTANAEGQVGGPDRAGRSFQLRVNAASRELNVPIPPHITNGDETLYPNRIGNFSQGLPHNPIGEVLPDAYDALLKAITTGKPSDFAEIPLGGTVKLVDPQGGLAFDLEGTDHGQLSIPPSPALAGAERAGEMVEDYWMALARDIPFSQYGKERITRAAITDLNNLSFFKGPAINGKVTAATLFRGSTPGELIGPYLSQFFLQPVNFGTLPVVQMFKTYAPGVDYLTYFPSWLEVQNGQPTGEAIVPASTTTFIKNGRDLGAWLRVDLAFQGYLMAALWLLGNGAPVNPGNPYLTSILANQSGAQTFGSQYIADLLGEVTNRALKAMWYQKWFVHRTLRPIAYGGLVHNTITRVAEYPIHKDVRNSRAIHEVFKNYGSYLLPAAYPEGGPQHPSYGEGHGVVAGACVTALKAFFNENFVIPAPVEASEDGQSLIRYTAADAGKITVGGELNKLADNVALGRDMAGVHWRSDGEQALLLGEKVTISILRDQRRTYNEPFNGFTFTKFNGATITV
jgi:hypothetical protein